MSLLKVPFFSSQKWRFPHTDVAPTSPTKHIQECELGHPKRGSRARLKRFVAKRIPNTLTEFEIDISGCDKAFASQWLSEEEVVIGTKCNKLIVFNVKSWKRFEIPTITKTKEAPASSGGSGCGERKKENTISNARAVVSSNASSNHPHPSVTPFQVFQHTREQQFRNVHQTAPANLEEQIMNYLRRLEAPQLGSSQSFSRPAEMEEANSGVNASPESRAYACGIHSISINPAGTLLATGAVNPNQIAIYELPTFEPKAILEGHMDWVFSVVWLDNERLVSGSRDSSVMLWSLSKDGNGETAAFGDRRLTVHNASSVRAEHRSKVRDLQFNKLTNRFFSLATDSTVKIWDAKTIDVISTVPLIHGNETVCLALDHQRNIGCIGSQSHISFFDPRISQVTHEAVSVDDGWGVRSLSFNADVVTVGGGLGRLSFYDIRAMAYINITSDSREQSPFDTGFVEQATPSSGCYRTTGDGWLNRDAVYMNHFQGATVKNAIYTHSYDPSGTRLFVAGGPLQLGLCGSYAGLWV